MVNGIQTDPSAITSPKYANKTDAIIDILKSEFFQKPHHPSLVAYALDRGLNALGFQSDLHGDYERINQNAIKNKRELYALEEVMRLEDIQDPAIKEVSKKLELHRQLMLEEINQQRRNSTSFEHQSNVDNPTPTEESKLSLVKNGGKFLNIASPVVSAVSIMGDYTEAMKKVKPFVDEKLMTIETARDYAVAITEGKLEQNATFGLSEDLGNARISKWVQDHPEIPNAILQELDLGGVREMQKIFSGPELES